MDTIQLGGNVGAFVDLDTKSISEGEDCYHFEGYAAAFNNVDRGKDMILPGAFAKSLRENGLPQLLYQHEMKEVVGALTDAKEDTKGLYVKGDLPKDDDFVRGRLYPQLKRRSIKSMSIGYKVAPGGSERRKSDGVRLLKELELWECSFVTIPMNPKASVTSVKGLIEFQDLPIDRESKTWDAKAAFERLRAKMGDNVEDLKSAFLFADEDKPVDQWDLRLLIADVDDSGCLRASNQALLKSSAVVFGGGDVLPQGAEESVGAHLERYFQRLNLPSPSKSWSVTEFEAQCESEREARLRGLGVSRDLAKKLLSGLREADRATTLREAGSPKEDAALLLTALAEALGARKR